MKKRRCWNKARSKLLDRHCKELEIFVGPNDDVVLKGPTKRVEEVRRLSADYLDGYISHTSTMPSVDGEWFLLPDGGSTLFFDTKEPVELEHRED